MGVLIDTNILIAYERGQLDVAARVAGRREEEFFLSVISASELLHGTYRAGDPVVRARRLAFVEVILIRFPILDIDLSIARAHAALWSDLAQRGVMIGSHDSWIAATGLARNLTVVTANTHEFQRVAGLRVENWLTPQEQG